MTDKGFTFFDQLHSAVIKCFKVIRGEIFSVIPIKPQPADIRFDGFDILHIFFGGVRVVKAQIGQAAVIFGNTKVEANGLGMPNMQVTIGFWWKARMHFSTKPTGLIVLVDNIADEVRFAFY